MGNLDDIQGSIGIRNQIKKQWDWGYNWIFERQGKGKKAEKPKSVYYWTAKISCACSWSWTGSSIFSVQPQEHFLPFVRRRQSKICKAPKTN